MYIDEDPKPVRMQFTMPSAWQVVWFGFKLFALSMLGLFAIIITFNILLLLILWLTGPH